jgi:signal transduction histidine kinase
MRTCFRGWCGFWPKVRVPPRCGSGCVWATNWWRPRRTPSHGSLPALPQPEASPAASELAGSFPVVHQGTSLGTVTVEMPPSDPLTPPKEKLIRDFASQAGHVLRNVQLVEDLKASRGRLVAAQDRERRALERNIHDGAQQQLVALAVKTKLAIGVAQKEGAVRTETILEDVRSAAQRALEDLRDVARGIYPPLLADKGLAAALEAQARKLSVPMTISADGIRRYPQGLESAVYFCSLEAIQNVVSHAGATRASIRLSMDEGELRFDVEDDGAGFDPAITGWGTGLQAMADRLEALGGEIMVRSSPGSGTSVSGRTPVGAVGAQP